MPGWIGERIDAVIFDHDGTLVDSEHITLAVVAEMAIEAGAAVYPEDADRFVGADLHLVIAEIGKRAGSPIDTEAFMAEFRVRQTAAIEAGLQEIPGASELIDALATRRIPYAVASNAPLAKMSLCLGATGLLDKFEPEMLISAYDVNAWKPDPAVFLAAAERLGVDPGRCAVVEDSKPGIDGALAAGMHVIALDPQSRCTDPQTTSVATLTEAQSLLLGSEAP